MKLTFHGHACFQVDSSKGNIIIDPWLIGNPKANIKPEDVHVEAILVTHGHDDHLGDTLTIAKKCNALVIAPTELACYCEQLGTRTHAMHIGGSYNFAFGKVKLTPAWHGSAVMQEGKIIYSGTPCGFLLQNEGMIIYHAGDTGLFSDMKLIGDLHKIDVALLPIGDNFTMGIDDAVEAVKMLKPQTVIPMHYNTFPVINQDVQRFVTMVNDLAKVVVLEPGESLDL